MSDGDAGKEDLPDSITESNVVKRVVDDTVFDTEEDVYESIERLQSLGASRKESLRIHLQYANQTKNEVGLYAVKGIGPTRGYRLEQAGIEKESELREQSAQELSDIEGISKTMALRIKERLQGSDIETSGKDGQSTPTTTDSSTQTGQGSSSTTTTENESEDPDSPSHKEGEVEANALSEIYESLRSVRKVLSITLQARGNPIDPDDIGNPLVQYYTMLDACLTFGAPDVNFSGYGPQHNSRLEFSVDDYRSEFGNGRWVTNYQTIDVCPFHPDTEDWLDEWNFFDDKDKLIRPVMPGSERPLPEFVETKEELNLALRELSRLPAYPELPMDPSATDRRVPIREIYSYIFSGRFANDRFLNPGEIQVIDELELPTNEGPVSESTPSSKEEIKRFRENYEKLTHIYGRIDPPGSGPIRQSVPVFSLDWYAPKGEAFTHLQRLVKEGDSEPIDFFLPQLCDLINRRFLQDIHEYDYITVFPGHEKDKLSPKLKTLAEKSVVDTNILYTPLLRRTETVERQRGKSREERLEQARNPSATLEYRSLLDGEQVLLLDDISTSGSSLLAGAYKLRQAGAGRVIGLTLGLTPGRSIRTKTIESPDSMASEIIARM